MYTKQRRSAAYATLKTDQFEYMYNRNIIDDRSFPIYHPVNSPQPVITTGYRIVEIKSEGLVALSLTRYISEDPHSSIVPLFTRRRGVRKISTGTNPSTFRRRFIGFGFSNCISRSTSYVGLVYSGFKICCFFFCGKFVSPELLF